MVLEEKVLEADDLVDVVDGEDKVLYVTQRWIADRDGLRMRVARAIMFDLYMEKLWIHRRSLQKPVNGGVYDIGIAETLRVEWAANTPPDVKEAYEEAMIRSHPSGKAYKEAMMRSYFSAKRAYGKRVGHGSPFVSETYRRGAGRGIWEEAFNRKGSLEHILEDVKLIDNKHTKLPPMDIPGSPRIYYVSAFYYNPDRHGPITTDKNEIEEGWWKTEPELQAMMREKAFMGVAPVIAQLALRVIRNKNVIPNNLIEVYTK